VCALPVPAADLAAAINTGEYRPGLAPPGPLLAAALGDYVLVIAWAGGPPPGGSLPEGFVPGGVLPTSLPGRSPAPPPREMAPLPRRQRQVLALTAAGCTAAQIARRLAIAPRTVQFHLSALRRRLGAASLAELTARAAALGLLTPDPPGPG
jgi:DNA-binding CsgD family transcriptional regulator